MTSILIIDDEQNLLETLRDVLQGPGQTVATALDAEQGLRRLREDGADLVITDILLPGMDGIEAIRQIARLFPEVRIIAMTGGGGIGLDGYRPEAITTCAYLQAAGRAGAHGLLHKPFGLKQLREMMQRVLRLAPLQAA